MITIRSKTLLLGACFIEAIWLLVAQTLNATVLLLPCLLCFLVLVGWAAIKNMAMPVVLFFLPFAPLLKFRPGTISLFTIALILIYGIYTVTGSRQVRVLHLIPALLLVTLTLIVKTAYGYALDNTYVLFAITLMLIPFLVREMEGAYDFYWVTICFALGICLAAITAQYLTVFPTINRYISVDVNVAFDFSRRSGYVGDPNFYSAHITAALSGLLVLLLGRNTRSRLFVLVPLICMLLYCGLLSVSKSFLLISICLLLLWLVALLLQRGRVSVKATLIVTAIVASVFLLSSTMFADMLDLIVSRFSRDTNLSDFTTGRTEVWRHYVDAMAGDVRLLLFGQGYTGVLLGEKATHNTLLQSVFQLGLIGCLLMGLWVVYYMRTLLDGIKIQRHQVVRLFMLLIGIFGSWMALDFLFLDDFFLLPIYLCMAMRFLHQQREEENSLLY
ncbi:MAG: hypothetical protein IKA50_06475 [Clostridia bacterium]|nr:hypothetical protein [Clostridia bacterium]